MKTLKNHSKKNEHTSQHTHVQNHVYTNKSRHTYVCDIRQLSNPDVDTTFKAWSLPLNLRTSNQSRGLNKLSNNILCDMTCSESARSCHFRKMERQIQSKGEL